MEVVISGFNGFIGENLTSYLEGSKHKIYSLNLREPWLEAISKSSIAIIHLAGKAHDLKNTSAADEYFKVNTDLTKQLFDVFLAGPARDFIFMSSVKAAADSVDNVLNEDVIPNPKTPYGASKLKAEEYILNQTLPKEKRVFILRPCMIHGPGNKGNLNLLYKVVKKGLPYPLGAFDNRRSFLSIDNLLFVIEAILNNPKVPGGVYNVADDDALATTEVIKIIAEAANRNPRIWHCSPNFIKSIAKLGNTFHLPLNSERLKKLTESYVVSNRKIKTALDISSLPISARQGLLHTIKSFEHKQL